MGRRLADLLRLLTPTAPAAPARDGAVVVRLPEGYRFHAFGEGGDWKLDAGGIIGKIISLKTALRDAPYSARRLREAQLRKALHAATDRRVQVLYGGGLHANGARPRVGGVPRQRVRGRAWPVGLG